MLSLKFVSVVDQNSVTYNHAFNGI